MKRDPHLCRSECTIPQVLIHLRDPLDWQGMSGSPTVSRSPNLSLVAFTYEAYRHSVQCYLLALALHWKHEFIHSFPLIDLAMPRARMPSSRCMKTIVEHHKLNGQMFGGIPACDYIKTRLESIATEAAATEYRYRQDCTAKYERRKITCEELFEECKSIWNPEAPCKRRTVSAMCNVITTIKGRITKQKSRSTLRTSSLDNASAVSPSQLLLPQSFQPQQRWDRQDIPVGQEDTMSFGSAAVLIADATGDSDSDYEPDLPTTTSASPSWQTSPIPQEAGKSLRDRTTAAWDALDNDQAIQILNIHCHARRASCTIADLRKNSALPMLFNLHAHLMQTETVGFSCFQHLLLQPQVADAGGVQLYRPIRNDRDLVCTLQEQNLNPRTRSFVLLFCELSGKPIARNDRCS